MLYWVGVAMIYINVILTQGVPIGFLVLGIACIVASIWKIN